MVERETERMGGRERERVRDREDMLEIKIERED